MGAELECCHRTDWGQASSATKAWIADRATKEAVMRILTLICTSMVFLAAGCAPEEQAPEIDLEAERSALMDADAAWAETAGDVEAFVSFFAEGGRFMPPGQPLEQGEQAIRETASEIMALPGFQLQWQATAAEVAASGDMGYTVGTYELSVNDAEGNPQKTAGKYLTVWKKQSDGQWKVVADCFNPDAPPSSGEQ